MQPTTLPQVHLPSIGPKRTWFSNAPAGWTGSVMSVLRQNRQGVGRDWDKKDQLGQSFSGPKKRLLVVKLSSFSFFRDRKAKDRNEGGRVYLHEDDVPKNTLGIPSPSSPHVSNLRRTRLGPGVSSIFICRVIFIFYSFPIPSHLTHRSERLSSSARAADPTSADG